MFLLKISLLRWLIGDFLKYICLADRLLHRRKICSSRGCNCTRKASCGPICHRTADFVDPDAALPLVQYGIGPGITVFIAQPNLVRRACRIQLSVNDYFASKSLLDA